MTIEATAALLEQVFPGTRISRSDYLRWLYEDSPFGPVVETNLDDERGRAGHYAVVPFALSVDGSSRPAALSLNTAVHERVRGGGVFVSLATETLAQAAARGIEVVIGVANANSTPGFLRRLGFELVIPLPATMLLPIPGRGRARSAWADEGEHLLRGTNRQLAPAGGLARRWTEETLAWRLSSPGARYALHRVGDALVVSTAERRHGVSVAVILAVFASDRLDAASARRIVRTVCRFHRAPAALHVGVNDRVAFRGVPLPRRLRPSPLNLIFRDLRNEPRPGAFGRMELIDFDAY